MGLRCLGYQGLWLWRPRGDGVTGIILTLHIYLRALAAEAEPDPEQERDAQCPWHWARLSGPIAHVWQSYWYEMVAQNREHIAVLLMVLRPAGH